MLNTLLATARGLSDGDLLGRVVRLAGQEREATVELVGHLAELDARKLFLGEGFGSLFAYCTRALRLSEHAAFNRIEAARLTRRFPAVLDLLVRGDLNLSSLRLLAPHLRPENFESVVARARGRTKREVEVLVAGLAPRPDAAPLVRRVPERAGAALAPGPARVSEALPVRGMMTGDHGPAADMEAMSRGLGPVAVDAEDQSGARPALTMKGPGPRAEVAPLSPGRYRLQFTIDAQAHDKLRKAQDLLRREIPNGDPGAIFDRALTLLLEDVARRKLAAAPEPRQRTAKPRPLKSRAAHDSRHVPAAVKRTVWLRDNGRCAFRSRDGRRCGERAFLEFHHREPHAMGGEATLGNISLRCRAHNLYEARLDFGVEMRPANSPRGELGAALAT